MQAVTFSAFRKNLRAFLDKTRDDAAPLLVTSKDPTANVVVINADDYDNLMENLHIMSNDYLMGKLARGKEQVAAGKAARHKLMSNDAAGLDR